MQPENLKFGGGIGESSIHPLVFIALILTGLLILFLRRQQVIVPVLYMSFLVSTGQQINVGGLHVLALRIVILVALLRALYSMMFSKDRAFPDPTVARFTRRIIQPVACVSKRLA